MPAKIFHAYKSQFPDAAWDYMLEFVLIGAITEERPNEGIYNNIVTTMEEANG
jgi:hypothetical protein